eukprot:scaffold4825_cov132-Cylindrotheca_fusiformis.AAC.12
MSGIDCSIDSKQRAQVTSMDSGRPGHVAPHRSYVSLRHAKDTSSHDPDECWSSLLGPKRKAQVPDDVRKVIHSTGKAIE